MKCTSLFAHSLDKLETIETTKDIIKKRCGVCGFVENLPHSNVTIGYVNNLVKQKKKWAAEDNAKELIQPLKTDGSINQEFTQVYGFNPFDDRTKALTPKIQGGLA